MQRLRRHYPGRTATPLAVFVVVYLTVNSAVGMKIARSVEEAAEIIFSRVECPAIAGYEVYPGQDHPGDNLGQVQGHGRGGGRVAVVSPASLAETCSKTDGCRGFSWFTSRRGSMGFLKSASSPRIDSPRSVSSCFYTRMEVKSEVIALPVAGGSSDLKSCADSKGFINHFVSTPDLGSSQSGDAACAAYGMTCVDVLDSACSSLGCTVSTEAGRMVECLPSAVYCSRPCDLVFGAEIVAGVWNYDVMNRCLCIPGHGTLQLTAEQPTLQG